MRLSLTVADPAGNVTLLVHTPVPREQYGEIARRLLALPSLGGEQVGYLTAPRHGGECRLEMMGGEFCGNALRSAGFWFASQHGASARIVRSEISGYAGTLAVSADPERRTSWAEIPLPVCYEVIPFLGEPLDAVRFEGILHLVRFGAPPHLAPDVLHDAMRETAQQQHAAALGFLCLDEQAGSMRPAVYVADTDSLYFEQSCASGSAAVASLCAVRRGEGTTSLSLRQPGGVIETKAAVSNGRVTALSIGGPVFLRETVEVDV